LDTHFDHSPAELLEDFRILIKALLLQVVKETIDLLLLALWVIALVKGYDGPLIEVFMDSFCCPHRLLPMILYDIAEQPCQVLVILSHLLDDHQHIRECESGTIVQYDLQEFLQECK
jgi:hypothetical protein